MSYVDQRKHLSRTQCFLEPTKAPSVRWAATSDTTQQLELPRDLALSKKLRLRAGPDVREMVAYHIAMNGDLSEEYNQSNISDALTHPIRSYRKICRMKRVRLHEF
jgi:hypothetical protein